ncbi:NUMOD4 domain-containing protein [Listeria monocytogenes]|uniref:HNH endonuclease n=1 Tax=Listeria monocytogenes TaxID=1639 RepID=A0A9P1SU07_LISMN|nr:MULTISPECIES: NUMOD4 domain-containing protein [Listeria]EAF5674472.1 HNH endonuclease [Listeria innocua]EAC2211155.1 HNH endonuclease [Listeria monocytogenes]EAC2297642.1 HNH endonuclease [Listeria monocytogenes]EAC2777454.1 HNH endonuclease [Listeria monocytogenes]EAC2789929.1 HNH endonuclease [Listeria monocytogenes]
MEIWKDVPGYELIYQASNEGNIRTHEEKTTFSSKHGKRRWKQRILKQKQDKGGYKRVSLWKNGNSKDYLVHRIIALTFIPQIPNKTLINHKDCNPSNNNVNNLEWCDYRENLLHAFDNRLNENAQAIVLVNSKTKETKYFRSKTEASRFLGKSHGYISQKLKEGSTVIGNFELFERISKN